MERASGKGPEGPVKLERSWKGHPARAQKAFVKLEAIGTSTQQGPRRPREVGKKLERALGKGPESPVKLERSWKEHTARAQKAPGR